MVETNLIESHDLLMQFIAKHTLDRFFLIGTQNVSVRSWIAREIVSNILVHREYASAFPAKIIIENNRIYAENWNKALRHGRIDPENFNPYPKNPILARFFVNIGLADQLGSGVRSLYKYTKIYSGGEPELIEGDIFKTIVPLSSTNIPTSLQKNARGNEPVNEPEPINEPVNKPLNEPEPAISDKITAVLTHNPQFNYDEIAKHVGVSRSTVQREIKKLRKRNIIKRIGSNKRGHWEIIAPKL
jgi:ATP-dependent DNA helicase RecG